VISKSKQNLSGFKILTGFFAKFGIAGYFCRRKAKQKSEPLWLARKNVTTSE